MISVLLVDDQASVRQGLRMALELEPDVVVVGEAAGGPEAIDMARLLQPDVVVLDVEMPEMDGIAAAQQIGAVAPAAAIVVLSLYGDPATRRRAEESGAAAFIAKQGDVQGLITAIRVAARRGE
jgi:two-component system, NarL family, response regulator DesR